MDSIFSYGRDHFVVKINNNYAKQLVNETCWSIYISYIQFLTKKKKNVPYFGTCFVEYLPPPVRDAPMQWNSRCYYTLVWRAGRESVAATGTRSARNRYSRAAAATTLRARLGVCPRAHAVLVSAHVLSERERRPIEFFPPSFFTIPLRRREKIHISKGWGAKGPFVPTNEPSHAQRERGDVGFVAFQE